MPRPRKFPVDFKVYADRFKVCEQTCRRWYSKGVNLDDLESVANHILRQKGRTATAAITAIQEQLEP